MFRLVLVRLVHDSEGMLQHASAACDGMNPLTHKSYWTAYITTCHGGMIHLGSS